MRAVVWAFGAILASCNDTDATPHAAVSVTPRASVTGAPPKPVAPRASGPARYPTDRTHSPIDAEIARVLRAIAANNPKLSADAFAKVGDSVTQSGDFMHCFADEKRTALGSHSELSQTLERFRKSPARPFQRESHAARVGWSAWHASSGAPSPLEREVSAIKPRFALVQYGTNDIENAKLHHFADKLFDIVDWLIARGTIPILFTIMPRRDRTEAAVWVPRYNAVIRGIAQARRVPLVDYHREIVKLPGSGLGKDGIHPSTYHGRLGRNACDLGAEGLKHGYNLRNLLALTALDRVARALAGEVLDPTPPARNPALISELPFVEAVTFPAARERRYRLELPRSVSIRVMGFDRGGEVDLVITPSGAPPKRTKQLFETRLSAGSHSLALETDNPRAETLLVVLAE